MRDFECVTKSASSPDYIRAAARSSFKLTTNYREAFLLFVGAHGIEFDMSKFPNRSLQRPPVAETSLCLGFIVVHSGSRRTHQNRLEQHGR